MSILLQNESKKIPIKDLRYYFDSVERDRMDQCSTGVRLAKILTLRDQLLSLSDEDFNVAIQTINKVVSGLTRAAQAREEANEVGKEEAATLYERVNETSSVGKTSAPPMVSSV